MLEAEASGLLDRLLGVFQDNSMDPILVDATLNCLAILIRSRPPISTKIVSAVLNFNPMKQANTPMTPRLMVIIRSMERTTRALLRWALRAVPGHPMEQKIQAYLVRLQQSGAAVFTGSTAQKRPAEAMGGPEDAKRQKLTGQPRKYPPMHPPPNSFAHLFILTEDQSLQQFDVTLLSADLVTTVTTVLLQHVDPNPLNEAINEIRSRLAHLQRVNQPRPVPEVPLLGPTGIDDEDDYDPEFTSGAAQGTAQTKETALEVLTQPAIELGPFELPKPPPMTGAEVVTLSDTSIRHLYELVASFDTTNQSIVKQKPGLNRLAASTNDRDSWATMLMRLATRAPSGLSDLTSILTDEEAESATNALIKQEDLGEPANIANRIRSSLLVYVLEDFRLRLNMAISWLTEEWYNDKITAKYQPGGTSILPNYTRWTTRLVDRLLPYLDAKDSKLLIRFLSEIPSIDRDILDRVKILARDPERVGMCVLAMQYLLMMRPPVRDIVLDAVESIWHDGDAQAKTATEKVLKKYRPAFLQQEAAKREEDQMDGMGKEESTNGDIKANGLQSPMSSASPTPVVPTVSLVVDPRKRSGLATANG
jgi:symplekin